MNIKQFKKLNKDENKHFFEPATLRFLNSKIESDFIKPNIVNCKQGFFITSEQYDNDTPRLYTIRQANFSNGNVDTIGKFQGYNTKKEAIDFIQFTEFKKIMKR